MAKQDTLQILDQVSRKLATITSLTEAKELTDQAAALRKYAKASNKGRVTQNQAAYVKLLCERRAGELLAAVPRSKGGGQRTTATMAPVLEEAGIAETTARRWQLWAKVPVSEFQDWLAEANAMEDEELTTSLVLLSAQGYVAKQKEEEQAVAEAAAAEEETDDEAGGGDMGSGDEEDEEDGEEEAAWDGDGEEAGDGEEEEEEEQGEGGDDGLDETSQEAHIAVRDLYSLVLEHVEGASDLVPCVARHPTTLKRWIDRLNRRVGDG